MTPPWPRGQRDRGHGRVPGALRPPRGAVGARHRGAPPVSPRRTALPSPPPDPSRSTCLTDACVRVASKILEALDPATDPCQDFYQYSCGGWIRRNPLPTGRSKWSTFNSIWDQNQAIMKHLLGGGQRWGHHRGGDTLGCGISPPHAPRAEPRSSPLVQKTPASTRAARRRGRRSATTCPASRSSASRSWAHSPWWSSSTRWEAQGPPGGVKMFLSHAVTPPAG